MFLELLPERMKSELYRHEEIGKLIEVVMDLGRPPIARFPTGDWVISETPVSHEDLRLAVSKVIKDCDNCSLEIVIKPFWWLAVLIIGLIL